MKDFISQDFFKVISNVCDELGVDGYVIGGYVRDCLLQRPCKDIDVVVTGSGIEVATLTAKKLGHGIHVTVFKNFGTAMLVYDDWNIEFVGARKESYRSDSRKPIVEEGSLEDDQKRRDFTINALAIKLNGSDAGTLSDPFNGVVDLNAGIIRTPLEPAITYSDDPLRMMRAIRFASQLNFKIEPNSLSAITENRERIKIVSKERITDELNKILMSPVPSVGFKLLFDTRLLHIIFPQMTALYGVEYVSGKGHKDNFYHTLQVIDNISKNTDNLWLRWAALLHDIAKPATKRFEEGTGWTFHGHEDKGARMVPGIFNQLKLPLNEKMKYVQKLVLLHLRPIVLSQSIVTDSAVRRLLFEAGEDVDDLMTLCQADITSKNEVKVKKYLSNFELVKQKLVEVEEKDKMRNWQPPVTGEMIMEAFNLKPGPEIGIIKNAIREAIIEGDISSDPDEAYRFMIEKGVSLGLTPPAGYSHK
ncbi:MAG: HD domain-containing protein [Bacteroidetes bacterium]|nr:HD domain-containing protein [Bacteroidota bacterium]MBL0071084.1 HD domain-containing protein [Bacteroidota bacterium]